MKRKTILKTVIAVAVALAFVLPGSAAFANMGNVENNNSTPVPLSESGSIVAWGNNGSGQCDVPSPNSDFTAVSAGESHSLGLKTDGSIVTWGYNYYGQCDVPSPNSDFTAVAGGTAHSLGLKTDGSIVAWGGNTYGECNVPSPNSGFTAVSAGWYHSLGLKTDGSIVAWGDNTYGQCTVPSPNSDFTAIAGGGYYSLGLKANGSIVAWGWNEDGEWNVPSPNSDFTAIAAGGYHSLGLKANGSIVAWGRINEGQCTVPSPNSNFTAVAAGWEHSLGLKVVPPNNNPPNTPSSPNPANGTTGVSVNVVLGWTGGDPDGDPVTYDVYFGTSSSPPKVFSNQTATTYDPPVDLNYNTQYYWKIVAWDNHSATTPGPRWNFTTVQHPTIEITIKGGLGVSATIKNTGTAILTNISWTITLDGTLIFFGKTKTDIIPTLAVGDSVTVRDFVIGFGKTGIAVEAGAATASATGTVILIFVIGVA